MRRWTLPSRAEQGRVILSGAWTTSICYKPREIERVEFVFAFILSLGFQLAHKTTCTGGGCLTRHSHYARVRLGGLTIWRIQCTSCQAVFTVLPHFALRYRRMSPDVAFQALIATHGGLSLEWCATICPISPMALYRLICALGQHSLVTVLVKCHLSLPTYILADEKHGRCLTDRVYLPTIVSGRVIWHLGYSDAKSAAAFTASYGQFQQVALDHEPSYQVKGALTDGFNSTVSSMRTLFPRARLGCCLRHALNKLPDSLVGVPVSVRRGLRSKFLALLHRCRQRKSLRVVALGQRLRHFANRIDKVVGQDHGERIRRWFEDKKAGWYAVLEDPQMPAMSTVLDHAAQRHRPQTFCHERVPPSQREPRSVSHGPGTSLQPDPISAPSPQRGQVWGGGGRWSRANIGLDAQPADPYVRWLSTSGDGRYHVIRWSLKILRPCRRPRRRGSESP